MSVQRGAKRRGRILPRCIGSIQLQAPRERAPAMNALLLLLSLTAPAALVQDAPWWGEATERALGRAGEAATAWRGALAEVPEALRPGLAHLVAAMPDADLRELPPARIVEEVRLATEVRTQVPWGAGLDDALFFEHVLPYAHVSESRDAWRAELTEMCLPMIAGCKTPGEAAQRLNEQLFTKVGVKYSTKRRRADQSPKESIEQGLASCTGLSILLADACRAVCVPARLAGTADWAEKDGNHTWVEVWDDGWHFTGACEPDPRGLDHGWFQGDAARAVLGDPMKGIWAVSWSAPGAFNMVWAPDQRVGGVEVTRRYLQDEPVLDDKHARLLVVLRDVPGGERIESPVRITLADDTRAQEEGVTRGEGADTNDTLEFVVLRGKQYMIQVPDGAGSWSFPWTFTVPRDQKAVRFERDLWSVESFAVGGDPIAMISEWFAQAAVDPGAVFPEAALQGRDAEGVRPAIVEAWRRSSIHADLRQDHLARVVRTEDRVAPYTVKAVGDRPRTGWPLVIAMHGGGGVPKEVNDQQWQHMQVYYKDHPEAGGYLYVALRAPNDNWDGFYDDGISPLVSRLITQLHLTEGVDTDRVHITGVSHGGYGAFVIGPKIPWRFASVHASAAAPTPGRTEAVNLRNTPFSLMVGVNDTAYGRHELCVKFEALMKELAAADPGAYPFQAWILPETGHFVPDKDLVTELLPRVRQTAPETLVWKLTDARLQHFSWLEVEQPKAGAQLRAERSGNAVTLSGEGVSGVWLHLDTSWFDALEPVSVTVGDSEEEVWVEPDPEALARHLLAVGDPRLACDMAVFVSLED